jgi:uncharacterized protein (TIGR02145 family)
MKKTYSIIIVVIALLQPFFCFSQNTGVMTDQSGKTYKTVKIGNLIWMAENLRTTKFSNGDEIKSLDRVSSFHSETAYASLTNGQFLYSISAVHDIRGIAPKGWHVPTNADWKDLLSNCNSVKDLRATSGTPLVEIEGYYRTVSCNNCKNWNSEYRRKVACNVCKDTRRVKGPYIPKSIINHNGNDRLKFNAKSLGYYYKDDDLNEYGIAFWSSSVEMIKDGYRFLEREYVFYLEDGDLPLRSNIGEYYLLPIRLVKD